MTEIKPVAWAYEFHEFGNVWGRHVILNRPDGGANPPTKHHGSEVRNVRPLYGPEAMAEIERLRAEGDRIEKACLNQGKQISTLVLENERLRRAVGEGLVAMRLASCLPGVSAEYDFSSALAYAERALASPASQSSGQRDYKRGLEDAAKVAENIATEEDAEWKTDYGGSDTTRIAGARSWSAGRVSTAIRALMEGVE